MVFGSSSGFSSSLELSELDGSNGFVINGIDEGDFSGQSVSGAGDVNGDGLDDIIIGARSASPNGILDAGSSYVVFGRSSGFSPSLELSELNGSNGFVINGIDRLDYSGYSVSSAGDMNGDGLDDIIIGAPFADPNGNRYAGESYVVFGRSSGFSPSLELSELDGSNGFVINGIDEGEDSGWSVSSAGDVNGDGLDDIIIGAPDGGLSYVVFGRSSGFSPSLELSELDRSNGFVINGIDEGDFFGQSVSGAGDVNGDGIDDIIIGASGADSNGNRYAGESYVVFGIKSNTNPTTSDNTLTTDEDIDLIFAADDFNFNDVDSGDSLQAVRIDTLPIEGTLYLDSNNNSVIDTGETVAPNNSIAISAINAEQFKFKPDPDESGTSYTSFNFSVGDGTNFSVIPASMTLNVTSVNDDPVAEDDTVSTNEDTSLTIATTDLLSNDSDPDGDSLTITEVNDAVNGTVALDGTNIIFTPDADFNGNASFNYTLSDGNGGEDTAIVNVTPDGDEPNIINGTPGRDILEGTDGIDIITGDFGTDIITGNAGNDVFVYNSLRDAGDIITDFTLGEDQFDFRNLFSSLGISFSQIGFADISQGTAITLDAYSSGIFRNYILVQGEGVNSSTLDNSDNFVDLDFP